MYKQSPKRFIKSFKNRNTSYGDERRLKMTQKLLWNEAYFPRTLSYEDFDKEIFKWVNDELKLYLDGKEFNTYKLFSNQRMTEYGQAWEHLDEKGNLDINFKTITREPNPQKGEIQGGNYNIPGNIKFPIFKNLTKDENGVEHFDVYSMKQPTQVNFIYTIGIFTNTYKMLNKMNSLIHEQFSSLEKYIFPNGFAIPMELNSVSDESEYTIDDRKYYSQTYQIKVMGYIIKESDYSVTKTPTRRRLVIMKNKNVENNTEENELQVPKPIANETQCEIESIEPGKPKETIEDIMNKPTRNKEIEIEELCGKQICWEGTEDELYVDKKFVITINLDYCKQIESFVSEYNMGLEEIQFENVKNYQFYIDDELINIENSDVQIIKGDKITIKINIKDKTKNAKVTMICYCTDNI